MTTSHIHEQALPLINAALEEYADWYGQVVRRIFFPHAVNTLVPLAVPRAFVALSDLTKSGALIDLGDLDRIVKLQRELQSTSEKMEHESRGGIPPAYEQFNDLTNMFDELLQRLRRIEHDRYLAGRGVDPVSGLRNGDVMMSDLEREMERVARRGRGFALTLARMDHAPELRARLGDKYSSLIKWLGQQIIYTMRTFDDGYRLDDHEFMMALKHTDVQGAQRFVSRLKEQMTVSPFLFNNQQVEVDLTFCVAEPVAGEDIAKFIILMRKDLGSKPAEVPGDVVCFEEVSPLQRFLNDVKTS